MLAGEYSSTSVAVGFLLRRVEGLEGFADHSFSALLLRNLKYVTISREPHYLLNTHMMVM